MCYGIYYSVTMCDCDMCYLTIFRDASGTSGCQIVSVRANMGVVSGWVLLFAWHFSTQKGWEPRSTRGWHEWQGQRVCNDVRCLQLAGV